MQTGKNGFRNLDTTHFGIDECFKEPTSTKIKTIKKIETPKIDKRKIEPKFKKVEVEIVAKAQPLKPLTTKPTNYDSSFEVSPLAALCDEMVSGSDHHEFYLLFRDKGQEKPLHRIGQTDILKVIENQIKLKKVFEQKIYTTLSKDVTAVRKHSAKMKSFLRSVGELYNSYYKEFDCMNDIKDDIINFYNNIHILLIVVYMIENKLEDNPHLTFSECIKNTNLDYQTRLKFHDLNRLRNVLIHNNISFKMKLADWTLLQKSFQDLSKAVNTIVKTNKKELLAFRDNWQDTKFEAVRVYETERMTPNEKRIVGMANDLAKLGK